MLERLLEQVFLTGSVVVVVVVAGVVEEENFLSRIPSSKHTVSQTREKD